MQWRMVMRRCPARSMTLVGDPDQTAAAGGVGSWRDALAHAARRAPVFIVVVVFNLVVAAAVAWIAVTLHGTIQRETGTGVLIGLAVGQVGVLGRIWVRIVALSTQASLRRLAA